jgi:hypothetical protein
MLDTHKRSSAKFVRLSWWKLSADDKAGGDIARPMRQQYNPRQDQPCADAPDHIALLHGKRQALETAS